METKQLTMYYQRVLENNDRYKGELQLKTETIGTNKIFIYKYRYLDIYLHIHLYIYYYYLRTVDNIPKYLSDLLEYAKFRKVLINLQTSLH